MLNFLNFILNEAEIIDFKEKRLKKLRDQQKNVINHGMSHIERYNKENEIKMKGIIKSILSDSMHKWSSPYIREKYSGMHPLQVIYHNHTSDSHIKELFHNNMNEIGKDSDEIGNKLYDEYKKHSKDGQSRLLIDAMVPFKSLSKLVKDRNFVNRFK